MNLVKKTFENWDEILPGLAVLVGIGTAVAMAFLDPRVAAIAGPLLGLVSYISGWIFEWPFEHWYRLGPVPGTRLGKPVGVLPSGIDLKTERSRTINMFTAEGHTWPKYDKWPDYTGAGVYNLAADRVRGKSKAKWKKLRIKQDVTWTGNGCLRNGCRNPLRVDQAAGFRRAWKWYSTGTSASDWHSKLFHRRRMFPRIRSPQSSTYDRAISSR